MTNAISRSRARAPLTIALALTAVTGAGPAAASTPVDGPVNEDMHDLNRVQAAPAPATTAPATDAEHVDGVAIIQKLGGGD